MAMQQHQQAEGEEHMTDLRKAAEMALEALETEPAQLHPAQWGQTVKALRQALTQSDDESLLKQGWRQCAVDQRTTQYCGMAEQARLEEREACAKVCEDNAKEWIDGNNDWCQGQAVGSNDCAAAIRARSEK